MAKNNYLVHPARLHDVLCLIQALGKGNLRIYGKLTEEELREWLGQPQSAAEWRGIIAEHPEFFRLSGQSQRYPTITVRWVNPEGRDQPLSDELLGQLMMIAIELHDRQERRRKDRWTFFKALASATIGAIGSLLTVIIGWALAKAS
jgi:hypothetical protein